MAEPNKRPGGLQRYESTRRQAVFVRNAHIACAMSVGERAKAHVKGLLGIGPEAGAGGDHHHDKQDDNNNNDTTNDGAPGPGGLAGLIGGLSRRNLKVEGSVGSNDDNNNEGMKAKKPAVQYRLEATSRAPKRHWLVRLSCCFLSIFGLGRAPRGTQGLNDNPNRKLAMYLHWMFRVNFVVLFAVMCLFFFGLVILFTGFITLAGDLDKECVRVGGFNFSHAGTPFADAFALSWTTFSTVGYGNVYPALSPQNDSPSNCFFVNFICTLESLVGILYSGFCGAILFGKILRIQSQAQVIFSDPVLIRYGPGLSEMAFEDDGGESVRPCPVLEFRIVNRLYNEPGGEIMDATINVVGNVDADDSDPSVHPSMYLDSDKSQHTASGTSDNDSNSEEASERSGSRSEHSTSIRVPHLNKVLTPVISSLVHHHKSRDNLTVDEDPSSRLVSKHVFSKMLIEASDHPFFKRVWLARHVLDENSPILKPRVRRLIRKNGGSWPERLNNYTGIRDSLRFNQILVSLNGVSNVSASAVYAQKIYDFVDVSIGYQFVNILYRDGDGQLGVDIDLINDVREQVGGGGEPLMLD